MNNWSFWIDVGGTFTGYIGRVPDGYIQMMTSAGVLTDADYFVGKHSLLSGLAGGVVGLARVAEEPGINLFNQKI